MKGKVKSISALGTRGEAKDKVFAAKPDSTGKFVLNRKNKMPTGGAPTNYASNKVFVNTMDEAAVLLATDEYLINLVSDEGTRALRQLKKVSIEYY